MGFAGQIAAALRQYKPRVPVVYNCGGYEAVETLRSLEGLVDVYLPDFKYADDALAVRLSNAPDYSGTALAALREMVRQTGENVYGDDGLPPRGALVRHPTLPAHTPHSRAVPALHPAEFHPPPASPPRTRLPRSARAASRSASAAAAQVATSASPMYASVTW